MSTEAFAPIAATVMLGRPAKHADAAARQRAWRAANKVKTLRLDGKLAGTVEALAAQFDCSETEVVNHLMRFALANRNWKTQGMTGWAMKDERFTTGKRPLPVADALAACCDE